MQRAPRAVLLLAVLGVPAGITPSGTPTELLHPMQEAPRVFLMVCCLRCPRIPKGMFFCM